jgi:hypothetical protein
MHNAELGKMRQEDHKFKASMGYIGDPVSKQTNKQTTIKPRKSFQLKMFFTV